MKPRNGFVVRLCCVFGVAELLMLFSCTKNSAAQTVAANLQSKISTPFTFVAYGDTRFHDPTDTEAANPAARRALVAAIARANPAFICFTGDIVYNGHDANDWKTWDSETSIFREQRIPVYPALGNHDLHGNLQIALGNYFQRFPDLMQSRYYSVRAANALILVLDSSLGEVVGPQGQWLANQLDRVPADVDFVFIVLHHPPYTGSSDAKRFGGGHSARSSEQELAKTLEERQTHARFRILVFSGHIHNYERHERNGVTYFVTGGGGAHAYPIERSPDDPFQSKDVNYHYLLVQVDTQQVRITMNRLELKDGREIWTTPDNVKIGLGRSVARESLLTVQ